VRRPWGSPDRRPAPPSTVGLLDPGEELVGGRRPVEEAFVARRSAIRLLVVPQRRQALERLVLHATSLRIPIVEVEGGTLTAIAGFDGHQGIALIVGPRRFASLDEILARSIERGEPPFVLVLDSLEDPQNVGTLLRSAEAAGIHGVVFPTRRQAPLSPAAIKASAGAVEHLLLCPVDDLAGALSDLRIRGLRVAGAEAGAPLTARQSDLRGPLAIVVGSEGQGLSPAVRRRCDFVVRIPMRGAIGSLNAAVAGSVLLFEAVAQRDPDGLASQVPPSRMDALSADETAAPEGEAAADDGTTRDAPAEGAANDGPASSDASTDDASGEEGPAEPESGPTMASPDEGSVTADPVVDELLPGGPAADPEDVDRA
jgi:23S rRNA (guanosine2251-2'-O)-methyltransferase